MLAERDDLDMTTAAAPLKEDEYDDPSAVKVVVNQKGSTLFLTLPHPVSEK